MQTEGELVLNRLLSEPMRLAILVALATAKEPMEFITMLEILKATKGNFAGHARKLEEAGLLEVIKDYVGRKPRTRYTISEQGRAELTAHLEHVEKFLVALKK